MAAPARPTFEALITAAVEATGAARGWLLALDGDTFVVVAAAGGDRPGSRVGRQVTIAGTAGYVLNSGQAAAIQPSSSDASNTGAGGLDGTPRSILAVPCGEEDVLGVIELVDKSSGPFSFDDVEVVSLLARVGGGALRESGEFAVDVPSPAELAAELTRLASVEAGRYRAVAQMIQAVLGQT